MNSQSPRGGHTDPSWSAAGAPPGAAAHGVAAFSLIELLVVLVVIAIMAGMLFPAIQLVKKSAQSLTCCNNLRQIGLGMLTYAEDNGSRFPPLNQSYDTNPHYNYFTNLLASGEYVPVAKWFMEQDGDVRSGVWLCPSVQAGGFDKGGGYGLLETWAGTTHVASFSNAGDSPYLAQVSKPSDRVLCCDAVRLTGGIWMTSIGVACPICHTWATSFHAAPRHGSLSTVNAVYFDGHVGGTSFAELSANTNDAWRHTNP